jgi:hypothetical protein
MIAPFVLQPREVNPVPTEYKAGWALRASLGVLEKRKNLCYLAGVEILTFQSVA